MPYGITSVTWHPAAVTFPPLPHPKLVLDLATTEGCKAELTLMVVISQDILLYCIFGTSGTLTQIQQNRLQMCAC